MRTLCRGTQFARIHTSSLINIEKILDRPFTKFCNSDDVNVIAVELMLIETRPTSFYTKHVLSKSIPPDVNEDLKTNCTKKQVFVWVTVKWTLMTTKTSLARGWSSTVDVYRRNDIEAHKLASGCYQPGKFPSPFWGNFTSTLAQCYLNFGIFFSSVASFFFFSLKLGGAPELSDIHDIQRCAK